MNIARAGLRPALRSGAEVQVISFRPTPRITVIRIRLAWPQAQTKARRFSPRIWPLRRKCWRFRMCIF